MYVNWWINFKLLVSYIYEILQKEVRSRTIGSLFGKSLFVALSFVFCFFTISNPPPVFQKKSRKSSILLDELAPYLFCLIGPIRLLYSKGLSFSWFSILTYLPSNHKVTLLFLIISHRYWTNNLSFVILSFSLKIAGEKPLRIIFSCNPHNLQKMITQLLLWSISFIFNLCNKNYLPIFI